ncbi:amino acid antiporter [Legionella quinlivanii]|uniref:Amino acid antiporter n=1 Tax=Legionella quinlivanii TaxID=45073 RepID=A0A0W0XZC5_9GAMM|nr:APC family permease [Legionella quinlivanii]KTD50157.1 amino acid antiporter [Legionella quinlivanii]MCW8450098.1 APC family permease [Legionella quinlivanii]SEF49218.1 amino acid/polyamine/organocation transporter, APC superfamily (TC 2.A.3) [Legionella quinlivanii DSM 21216]STY11755.1 amino acid antiporter [Legionella quinlivanii]
MKAWSSEKISVLALVLLITGAIDSIRNLPATALFGSSLIFFFSFSAIVFLIPVALVSAELSSTWSEEEGGVFSWVKHAFGETLAFFTIWLQWINTMVWYPTILSFIAGTLAYLVNPALAQNKYYLIAVILTVFWSLTLLGLSGLKASARFASFCAIFGMIIPMAFIILLAIIWLIKGQPIAVDLSPAHLLPHWGDTQSWVSLTAIMTSFLGMELAAVHVRNVESPQHNFPKAMFFSVLLILSTMIFGSLAIAFVLPQDQISLVDGVMQAFSNFFQAYHMTWLMPLIIVMLLLGSLGGMVNWIISPAKGLLLAADNGFLPHWLYRLNKHGIASRILILQAILVTLLCSGFLLFPSVNAIYWLFTDLSTELYILMYVFMFIAAWRLKSKAAGMPRTFQIPGGKAGYYATCLLGLIGCFITLAVGFIPPENSMDIGGAERFRLVFSCGILMMILPAFILYLRRRMLLAKAGDKAL